MTPEERQMLTGLFDRIRAMPNAARDAEAEDLINSAVRMLPTAPYVLAQTVLVQQQALENATRRITELEAQLKSAPSSAEGGSFLGNIGRSLFGNSAPAAAQPRPVYAQPQPQAGPWGAAPPVQQGGGFLQGALQTATGVAGGMLAANALEGLFGGHHSGWGGGFAGQPEVVNETVNNYYGGGDVSTSDDVVQDDASDAGFFSGGGGDDVFGGGGGGDDWT